MRLEITRRSDLAVRALVVLGRASERMKGPELAAIVGATPAFLVQVMSPLVRSGWVRSDPGPNGGYMFVGSLDEIDILQVIESVDGPLEHERCVVHPQACDAAMPCALHEAWTRARAELERSLKRMKLSSLDHNARLTVRRR